jgi:RNA polymerase sigma factor (sigma-70 family)
MTVMAASERTDQQLRELMRAAQNGDAEAYSELLQAVANRVRPLVRRRRGSLPPDAVEDVVQDILLSVHAVRHTYDAARPFTPWLLAVARHRLADRWRREARVAAHERAVDDLEVSFGSAAANSHDESLDDARTLVQAIRQLPPSQRQAIDLLKIRELSLKEASARSGVSIGALKVATHRAMAALRKALGHRHGRTD